MGRLVILSTPFFCLRVKWKQPSYGPLPADANRLGCDAEFSQKTCACISGVDCSALCTKSPNAGCTTGQDSRTSSLFACSDMISAGGASQSDGALPAEPLGANEAAATARP